MAKKGRPKNIETPDLMWQYFCAYRDWVKANPIKVEDWVGGMAKRVTRKKERPLTLEGFENYCFEKKIINDLGHYFSNLNEAYTDFLPICSRIRRIIREEQISGGMAGIYNPSITQRLNALVEQTRNENVEEITVKLGT